MVLGNSFDKIRRDSNLAFMINIKKRNTFVFSHFPISWAPAFGTRHFLLIGKHPALRGVSDALILFVAFYLPQFVGTFHAVVDTAEDRLVKAAAIQSLQAFHCGAAGRADLGDQLVQA
jgi:hypothetical protein